MKQESTPKRYYGILCTSKQRTNFNWKSIQQKEAYFERHILFEADLEQSSVSLNYYVTLNFLTIPRYW